MIFTGLASQTSDECLHYVGSEPGCIDIRMGFDAHKGRLAVRIDELVQDKRNANKGTKRGRSQVAESLKRFGAGRSVLIDRNGVLIAGNKTASQAQAAGIDEVIVVQTNGRQLVAVQRTDLDIGSSEAQALAIADNRVAEVGLEWDKDVLADLVGVGDLDLEPFFTADELAKAMGLGSEGLGDDDRMTGEGFSLMIEGLTEPQQTELLERLGAEGYKCRALIF